MNVRQMLGMKPKTLGEGLKRVKNYFNVKGENLSTTPGTRQYSCYTGKEVLNIKTEGKPYDSCLLMTVNSKKRGTFGENYYGRDLLGKTSDVTKSYARRHLYQHGKTGTYNERRIVTESFQELPDGKIEGRLDPISKVDVKVIEPWELGDIATYSYNS